MPGPSLPLPSPGVSPSVGGCGGGSTTKHDVQTSHAAMMSPRRRREIQQQRESLRLLERDRRCRRTPPPLPPSLPKKKRGKKRSVSVGGDRDYGNGDGRDEDDDDHEAVGSTSSERQNDGVDKATTTKEGSDDDAARIRQGRDTDGGGGEQQQQRQPDDVQKESVPISIMYGLINIAIVLPVIMSFGTIIYSDPEFAPYLPVLVKLTVISGAVHQLCFSVFSTLPFAIGQVQDAGLIFLSAMAHKIVVYCRERSGELGESDMDAHILATTTILLPMCTAILGFSLIAIGRANLARWVQMLPTPVVGGYLAYIGFFCGQSGLALMANVDVRHIEQWGRFADRDAFVHLLPGLVGGIAIYVVVRRARQMFVLPACIAALIVAFYGGLRVAGSTVEDARRNGWVNQSDAPPPWYKTWEYLQFDKVEWGVFPHLIVTLVSMILVVALSSCLDVAAIELELKRPLDYDHELRTVGLSNVVSGLTGGYSGSYIFSQTIFSLRAGIRTRVCGLVIALCEIVAVVLPFSVLSYVPNYFFGSLLVMICADLTNEWLWDARLKMTRTEYAIDLSSFCLIQALGVEYGILAGLLVYVACRKMGMNVGDVDDDDDEVVEIMGQSPDVDSAPSERETKPLVLPSIPSYGCMDKSGDDSNEKSGVNGHGHDLESDVDDLDGRSNGYAAPTEKTHLI